MEVCEKIKYSRMKKGLTQEGLAFEANISVKTVQRAEQGIQVSLDALKSISNVLGIDYDYLLDDRKHISEIKREFTQQADFIDKSDAFRSEEILKNIIELADIKKNSVVLDLACGTGIVTNAIAHASNHILAVDITDEMVRKTQSMCDENEFSHIEVLKGHAERLNFKDEYFDCIVTKLSIHHFKNPFKVLEEMKRVLKKGGIIVIADIYASSIKDEARLHNAIEQLRDPTHTQMLSLEEYKELFRLTNLEVNLIKYIDMQRHYDEWLKITNAPERYDAIFTILENLIQCDRSAGINLQLNGDNIDFIHKWVIYKLKKN